jgi:hypothetical protein
MSYTSREIIAPVDLVWQVLIDPETYPEWLVGAKEIRDVDADWPEPGSSFHHSVGTGPFTINDRTTVKRIDHHRLLQLSVRARPFIAAVASFCLVSDGHRTVVSLEEEPEVPVIGQLVRPVLDPATHHRNHRSLRQLERFVASRAVLRAAETAGRS